MPSKLLKLLFALALMTGVAACGDDSESADDTPPSVDVGTDENSDEDAADTESTESTDTESTDTADAAGMSSGGAGSLTLDGETIELEARCFLEEQVSAGMTMEYTAQGMGTNADGDDVLLDITRFAAGDDAVIVGDSVSVTIGDPFSPEATSLERIPMVGLGEPDVVARDGGNVSGTDVGLIHDDTGETVAISFELTC